MSDYLIMKAVEFDKLSAAYKKQHTIDGLADEGYWLQRKYDGCFGIATLRAYSTSSMQSRTGEDYTASTGHILAELESAVSDSPFTGSFVFLGEVWRPINEAKFPAISGQFRKQQPCPALRFVANDILTLEEFESGTSHRSYATRYAALVEVLPNWGDVSPVSVAETYRSGEWAGSPVAYANLWKNEGGFDGAIVRNPHAGYQRGTVKKGEIIKVKPVESLDLKVVLLHTATGAKTGRPVYTIDVSYKGVTTTVGSGMPHSWKECPKPGEIAEIEFMGFTEDGALREPRFKGTRHDKTGQDE